MGSKYQGIALAYSRDAIFSNVDEAKRWLLKQQLRDRRLTRQTPDLKGTTMQFHLGRLIDHVHLRVSDLEASKGFYRAVIASLGRPASLVEGSGYFHIDELVDKADGPVSRVRRHPRHPIAKRSWHFTRLPSVRVGAITARPVRASITPGTTARSSWIRTATTSRRCFTARPAGPPSIVVTPGSESPGTTHAA